MNGWDDLYHYIEEAPPDRTTNIWLTGKDIVERLDQIIKENAEIQDPYTFIKDFPFSFGFKNTLTGRIIWIPSWQVIAGLKGQTRYLYHFKDYHRIRAFAVDYISKGIPPE